jgi:hypothetical protein
MTHAEDLIDRAWDAKTDKTRLKLARQAIAIDPDSLDWLCHHRPIAWRYDGEAAGAS